MKRIVFFLGVVIIASCKRQDGKFYSADTASYEVPLPTEKELPPSELIKYVRSKQSGLTQKETSGEITYTALYKPVDYVISMEEETEGISRQLVESKRKELQAMQYIDLKIETSEGEFLQNGNAEEHSRKINYCSFDMQKDIKLIEGEDTLACGLFHFERTNDIAPYATFLLGFPVKNKRADKVLVINDRLFNKGSITLEFRNSDIKKTPVLKTI